MSIVGHNHNSRSINSLTAEEKAELKKTVQDLNDSLTRAAAERELQKEAITALSDKLGIDKKLIRRLAKTYFKANFNEESEENKTFEDFYTMIINPIKT
jgi:ribosome-binding protein aMBF1 (putative translation factor)